MSYGESLQEFYPFCEMQRYPVLGDLYVLVAGDRTAWLTTGASGRPPSLPGEQATRRRLSLAMAAR